MFNSLGFQKQRERAPRMYCDICEMFDLHETEDCPHQSNDDLPAEKKSTNVGERKRIPDRPYCEICEGVFLFFERLL